MDRVQRDGGTAGLITAVLLAVLFVLFLSLGQEVMTPGDPTRSLAAVTQQWGLFAVASVVGLLATGFAVPFVTGVAARMLEAAPTRARAILYVTLIGLVGYALGSTISLLGGRQIVEFAARDRTGGAQAWATLSAVTAGFDGLGAAFTGAGTILAGSAILSTKTMPSGLAWIGIFAGALNVLTLFAPGTLQVMLGGFLLTIIWAAWAGIVLRAG